MFSQVTEITRSDKEKVYTLYVNQEPSTTNYNPMVLKLSSWNVASRISGGEGGERAWRGGGAGRSIFQHVMIEIMPLGDTYS